MTHYTERNLNQKCIYWGIPVADGYGGYAYSAPVELSCRWEYISMVDITTREVVQQLRSEIFLDQDVDEQGMLLLGKLADLNPDYTNDPASAGAQMITRFDKIPDLQGMHFVRKAFVGRLWTGKS